MRRLNLLCASPLAGPSRRLAVGREHGAVLLSRAKLPKRRFEIDMGHCPSGDGELKIIAAILEQPVIEKTLTHLGLQAA
jgi:hypothetical protein